jgi:N-acetylneuraminate synthase
VALGACIIEKHFTLNRDGGGPDDSFSLEPPELAALCASARIAWQATGQVDYSQKSSEIGNVKFRRSLYFVRSGQAGDIITPDMVRSVRPGYGLEPKYYEQVIGSKLRHSIIKNSPICWSLIERK